MKLPEIIGQRVELEADGVALTSGVSDSPLEGSGFELSVAGARDRDFHAFTLQVRGEHDSASRTRD